MKKALYISLLLVFTFTHAQNDMKARLEFEEAETSFLAEDYENTLKHLTETEKLIGKWTPVVSFMKIETLFALTDTGIFSHPKMQPLYEEVTKYMTYLNNLNNEDVPMEKYKIVYNIEKIFTALKFSERQSVEFLKAKKEHDAKNYGVAFPLWEKLAEKGNSWAMRNIGNLYEKGWGRDKDLEKAKEWYIKAFNNGNASAAQVLATLEVGKDRFWIEKAASLGHPYAIFRSGYYFESQEKNSKNSIPYYIKGMELGSAYAALFLGVIYMGDKAFENYGIKTDKEKGLKYIKIAANKGHGEAADKLSFYEKDITKKLFWKKKAYDNGYDAAIDYILLYEDDKLIKLEYLKKKAEKGDADSQVKLGDAYMYNWYGNEIKDATEAMKWYLKAANNNNISAMYSIGIAHKNGVGGLSKDINTAELWYKKGIAKAVETKDQSSEAQGYHFLGTLYNSISGDYSREVITFFEKAIGLGHNSSRLEAANLYYSGKEGLSKNYQMAAKYYEEYYNNENQMFKDEFIKDFSENLIDIFNTGGYGFKKNKAKAKYWQEISRK